MNNNENLVNDTKENNIEQSQTNGQVKENEQVQSNDVKSDNIEIANNKSVSKKKKKQIGLISAISAFVLIFGCIASYFLIADVKDFVNSKVPFLSSSKNSNVEDKYTQFMLNKEVYKCGFAKTNSEISLSDENSNINDAYGIISAFSMDFDGDNSDEFVVWRTEPDYNNYASSLTKKKFCAKLVADVYHTGAEDEVELINTVTVLDSKVDQNDQNIEINAGTIKVQGENHLYAEILCNVDTKPNIVYTWFGYDKEAEEIVQKWSIKDIDETDIVFKDFQSEDKKDLLISGDYSKYCERNINLLGELEKNEDTCEENLSREDSIKEAMKLIDGLDTNTIDNVSIKNSNNYNDYVSLTSSDGFEKTFDMEISQTKTEDKKNVSISINDDTKMTKLMKEKSKEKDEKEYDSKIEEALNDIDKTKAKEAIEMYRKCLKNGKIQFTYKADYEYVERMKDPKNNHDKYFTKNFYSDFVNSGEVTIFDKTNVKFMIKDLDKNGIPELILYYCDMSADFYWNYIRVYTYDCSNKKMVDILPSLCELLGYNDDGYLVCGHDAGYDGRVAVISKYDKDEMKDMFGYVEMTYLWDKSSTFEEAGACDIKDFPEIDESDLYECDVQMGIIGSDSYEHNIQMRFERCFDFEKDCGIKKAEYSERVKEIKKSGYVDLTALEGMVGFSNVDGNSIDEQCDMLLDE